MARARWPPLIRGTSLSAHLVRLNTLVDRALDDQRESPWYLVYNYALTFIATRTESGEEPMYIWPQGSLYAFKGEEAQEEPGLTDRRTRSALDLTQRRISDLGLHDASDSEETEANVSLLVNLSATEEDLQETSEATVKPRERFRTPDFLVVLHPSANQDILVLGVEVKRAGAPDLATATSRFGVVFDATLQQAFEQAQMAFRRYPDQNVVYVMLAVGLRIRFLKYERYCTPTLEDEDAASVTARPYESIPTVTTAIFYLLDNEDRKNARDYNVQFKKFWTQARKTELTNANDEGGPGTGDSSDSEH